MTTITYRASSCPRIIECGGSTGGDILIDESTEVGAIGDCIHDMIATMIREGAPSMPDPERFLELHGVEKQADDIRFLSLRAHRLWHGYKNPETGEETVPLKKHFPHPIVEIKRSYTTTVRGVEVTLSGHMDLSTFCDPPNADTAIIADWKGGYKSETHRYVDQLKGYAFLQAAESPKIQKVIAIIAWLRDGYLDIMEFTRDELKAWAKKFFFKDIWWDGKTYSPGWACDYCPRKHSCPGRCEMIVGGVNMFGPGGEGRGMKIALAEGHLLPAENFHRAVTMCKYIISAGEQFLAMAKSACLQHGPFPLPEGGKQYAVREKKGKTTINVDVAWPILTKHLTQNQLGAVVTVGKGALEKALRATAKSGKQKLVEKVFDELDEIGALTQSKPSKTMELTDIPKEQS